MYIFNEHHFRNFPSYVTLTSSMSQNLTCKSCIASFPSFYVYAETTSRRLSPFDCTNLKIMSVFLYKSTVTVTKIRSCEKLLLRDLYFWYNIIVFGNSERFLQYYYSENLNLKVFKFHNTTETFTN